MHRPLLLALHCLCISVILFAALASTSLAAASPAPAAWLKLEAPGFTIYSDASEKQVVACALRYAAFRQAFGQLFVPPGRKLPPSVILIFRTNRGFHEIAPQPADLNRHQTLSNISLEIDGTPLNAFSVSQSTNEALERTFGFETVWALRQLGYTAPVWAAQGAGEVLATVRIDRGQCVVGASRRAFTTASEWPRFFTIGTASPEYQDPAQLARFLDQAWGVMHWVLLSNTNARDRFSELVRRLRTQTGAEALAAVMHTPAEQFSRAIRYAVHAGHFLRLPLDETAVRSNFRLAPAPAAEVLVQKAAVLESRGETAAAEVLFAQIQSLDSKSPVVLEALARRALAAGQHDTAMQAYRAAINAGTQNPVTYLRSAEGRLNDSRSGAYDVLGEGGHQAELAVQELRTAIKIDPDNRAAYVQLGRAFFVLPKVTPDLVAELSVGVDSNGDGARVRYYRALLHSRLGQHDEALADLRAITGDGSLDDSLREQAEAGIARETLARDLIRAEALLRAKDYAAVRALSTAGAATASAADAARYRKLAALADAEEAWDALAALAETGRWPEIHAAAEKYVTDFPASPHTNDAYDLLVRSAFPDRATRP